MRLLGQRPRYQEGPPEGAGHVRWPPPGARRSADGAILTHRPEDISPPFALPPAAERTRPDRGDPRAELPIGAEGRGTPDRSKLFGSHGQRPWLHDVVKNGLRRIPFPVSGY